MGVFFSGTDSDELSENSEFYNYYLSLIVNNRNEMVAKVAFRAKVKSTSQVEFKLTDGSPKTKGFPDTEEEVVYTIDCLIEKPRGLGESFYDRFQEVDKPKVYYNPPTVPSGTKTESKAYAGFNVSKAWENWENQSDLFEDARDWGESESGATVVVGGEEKQIHRQTQDKIKPYKPEIAGRTDKRIYSLLVKLITGDILSEEGLETTLKKEMAHLYPEGEPIKKLEANYLYDQVEVKCKDYYRDLFPEDYGCTNLEVIIEQAISMLGMYEEYYLPLVKGICEALDLANIPE